MAITLAADELGDAVVTDNIGHGEVASAALLWVRYWPTALVAARECVEPAEVPGLAAEALIGTVAAITIGRGPREDPAAFVAAAVRELGEDDGPAPDPAIAAAYPDVFPSPMMAAAFVELDPDTQRSLLAIAADGLVDEDGARSLTVLQHYYLAEHADSAPTTDCRRAHIALMAVAEGSTKVMAGASWVHLSTCAWCTEAFHEVCFSNVELGSLLGAAVLDDVPAAPVVPVVEPAAASAVTAVPMIEPWVEPDAGPYDGPDSGPTPAPAPAPVPLEDTAPLVREPGSTKRARLIAAAALTAAAVAVVAAVLTGVDDNTTPTSAGATPSSTPTGSTAPSLPDLEGTDFTGTPLPSAATFAAAPSAVASASASAAAAAAAQEPTPSATPTQKPTRKPSPTAKPSSSAPPTTAAPSPTATPTRRCTGLQKLLGVC